MLVSNHTRRKRGITYSTSGGGGGGLLEGFLAAGLVSDAAAVAAINGVSGIEPTGSRLEAGACKVVANMVCLVATTLVV